ncbi:MAG: YraN family protein [Clostridiales bacterium]|jgi:putative endonuclease|nr:YraN family protein [Clostridiales bacterium]
MMTSLIGAWGEEQAAEYLKRKGLKLLECGYRSRFGEIDLIMREGGVIVFVEVKLRSSSAIAAPREYVSLSKQEKLRRTAMKWLAGSGEDLQPRFDVVEVYASQPIKKKPEKIVHLENAF